MVEPEVAEVVRRIYRMALEGYGLAETAAQLAADGVVNPTYYWRSRGTSRGGAKSTVEPTKWGHTTIKKIHLAGILWRCDQLQKLLKVLQDEKADREPGRKPGDLP